MPGSATGLLPVSWRWKAINSVMKRLSPGFLFIFLALATTSVAGQFVELNGIQIMEEVHRRHQQYPYVYEEQAMVMRDRDGKRDTRKAHRYSRVEEDGTAKFMLVFDYPDEIRGVAILASRDASGKISKSIYLPAFAEQLIETSGDNNSGSFLGTDFSVENIIGENLTDYQFLRRQDRKINEREYFVVDVYRLGDDLKSSPPLRRHFIQKDIFFITLTEHYDNYGRLQKKQSYHDLTAVDGDMWRAGMILIEDVGEQHETLLKVTRRLYSHDYVPEEIFTADWLYKNQPYEEPEESESMDGDDLDISVNNEKQLSQLDGEGLMQP